MSACLLDCLREAQLEQYFPSFVQKGVTNCEHLIRLSMPDYPHYGVTSMESRVKLFKLIQIVKSVQADGIYCQHDGGIMHKNSGSQPTASTVTGRQRNDVTRRKVVSVSSSAATAHVVSEGRLPSNHSNVRGVPPMGKTKEEKKATRNRKTAAGTEAPNVEFKQGSDEPFFHCRKTLNFSDSSMVSDEEEEVGPVAKLPQQIPDTITAKNVATKLHKAVASHLSQPEAVIQTMPSTSSQIQRASSDIYARSHLLVSAEEASQKSPEKRTLNVPNHSHTNSSSDELRYMKNPCDKTDYQVQMSLGSHLKDSSDDVGGISDIKSDLHRVPSGTTNSSESLVNSSAGPPVQDTKNHVAKFETPMQEEHYESPLKSILGVTAEAKSITRPPQSLKTIQHPDKCVVPISSSSIKTNHAYFPLESPEYSPKRVQRQRVYHNSGYNYGLPHDRTPKSARTYSVSPVKKSDRICVCVRKRPLTSREMKRGEVDVVQVGDGNTVMVEENKLAVDLSKFIQEHVFSFDQAFGESASNQHVYLSAVKPLVTCVFNRGAATCFAFGQTGAGKTHTLLGNKLTTGLYQLAAIDILSMIQSPQLKDLSLKLWVSFYEIYNSQLYDLLNKRKRLYVRENGKQKVCITGLMETQVTNVKGLTEVVRYGSGSRSTGSSGANSQSSRSHAILQMEVRDSRDFKVGRLSFIDLAGSERATDSHTSSSSKQNRLEGAEINQSLLALKECIRCLDQASGYTPYRQSKLTHILRESFTGNCRTVMIANIAPTQTACDNTLNTLRYADRVKDIGKESRLRPSAKNSVSPKKKTTPMGTLFHPSNIQFSSTPKAKGTPLTSSGPLDLTNEALESPIRGHQVRSSRHSDGPSDEDDHSFTTKDNKSESNNMRSETDSKQSSVDTTTDLNKKNASQNLNVDSSGPLISPAEPPGKAKPSLSAHGGSKFLLSPQVEPQPNGGPSAHSTPCQKTPSSTKSEEDIIREHQEIMNHLDVVLDKAKSVMKKTNLIAPQEDVPAAQSSKVTPPKSAEQRKSSVETARALLKELRATGQPLQAKRFAARRQFQQMKTESKSQPDIRGSCSEGPSPRKETNSQESLEQEQPRPTACLEQEQPRPTAGPPGGLLNMLRAREQSREQAAPNPAPSSGIRRWHLSDPFPVGMRRSPAKRTQSYASSAEASDGHAVESKAAGDGLQILKSLTAIRNARKMLHNSSKQTAEGESEGRGFSELLASPSNNRNSSASSQDSCGGRQIPILLLKAAEVEALKTQAITRLSRNPSEEASGSDPPLPRTDIITPPSDCAQPSSQMDQLPDCISSSSESEDLRPPAESNEEVFYSSSDKPATDSGVDVGARSKVTFKDYVGDLSEASTMNGVVSEAELPAEHSTSIIRGHSGLVIHQDSAFTKVSVSRSEVDQIRQTALSHGVVLSDTSGGSHPSANNSEVLFQHPGDLEYKRSPVRMTDRKVSATDSVFSPIMAFPVTARDNPEITVPCVTKLELSSSSSEEKDSEEQSPQFLRRSQENVSRTLEKQLRKLKEELSPSQSPASVPPPPEDEEDKEEVAECAGSEELNGRASGASSLSSDSGECLSPDSHLSALHRAQSSLLVAHEEQLSSTTSMCKQEMQLLMQLRQGEKDFDEYLRDLQEIVLSKLHSVTSLHSHIKHFYQFSHS